MTKKAILKKRVLREYNKPSNWEYSKSKGFSEGTYFGYKSFNSLWKNIIRNYLSFYGKNLKRWKYS